MAVRGERNKFNGSQREEPDSPDLQETVSSSQCSDLQVQVDHAVLVEEGHSLQDLPHQPLDVLLAEGLLF